MPHTISADPSKKRRLLFRTKRDGTISISFLDANGAALDISQIVFDLQFRTRPEDTDPKFEFTEPNGGIVHTSISSINIAFTIANTTVKPMEYFYTFNRLKLADNTYKAWLNGPGEATDDEVDNDLEGTDTITIDDNGTTIYMTISDGGGSGTGGGHVIKQDGTSFTQRTNLDFQGGLIVTDNSSSDSTEVQAVGSDLFLYYNFY